VYTENIIKNKKKVTIQVEIPKEYKIDWDTTKVETFSELTDYNVRSILSTKQLLD
jgi:hypothetical protein